MSTSDPITSLIRMSVREGFTGNQIPVLVAAYFSGADAIMALKSVNEVLREYEDLLTRYVIDAANGNMSAGEMSRAHKSALKRIAPQAYDEGLREGGVSDPEAERDEGDDETIDDWVKDQSSYTLDFASAAAEVSKLKGDEKTEARRAVLDRVVDWVNALRTLANKGFASAKENMTVTWEYGDTEHCDTCQSLNGKTRRLKWFTARGYYPREPGSPTLACSGFKCLCKIVDAKGRQVLP